MSHCFLKWIKRAYNWNEGQAKRGLECNSPLRGEEVRMKGKADPSKELECSSYAHIRADCGVCITLMFQQSLRDLHQPGKQIRQELPLKSHENALK